MKTVSSDRGFSLPEVLIAVAMFGVMAAALSSVILLNVRSNRISKETTTASSIAQSKLEFFRGRSTAPTTTGSPETITMDSLSYTRSWSVSTASLPPGVALVTVSVTWREPQTEIVTLSSYVTF